MGNPIYFTIFFYIAQANKFLYLPSDSKDFYMVNSVSDMPKTQFTIEYWARLDKYWSKNFQAVVSYAASGGHTNHILSAITSSNPYVRVNNRKNIPTSEASDGIKKSDIK